jgi:FkbH-like protein
MDSQQRKFFNERMHLQSTKISEYLNYEIALKQYRGDSKKIQIISSYSTDLLSTIIRVNCFAIGLPTQIFPNTYQDIELQLLQTETNFDLIFLILSDQDLVDSNGSLMTDWQSRLTRIVDLADRLDVLMFSSPILPIVDLLSSDTYQEVNNFWKNLVRQKSNASISNLEWQGRSESSSVFLKDYEKVFDPLPFTHRGLKRLALDFTCFLSACFLPRAKVLLLDLDNTIWKGILGESTFNEICDSIKLKDEFFQLQQKLLELSSQGLLLCLLSKNNSSDVVSFFENCSEMPLKLESFAVKKIDWKDKATNATEIASHLNLGVDSFIYLDDSAFERQWMREKLPMIFTPEIGTDQNFLEFLDHLHVLRTVKTSKEDEQRLAYYKNLNEFEKLKSDQADSLDNFLESLQMKSKVTTNSTLDSVRAHQLIVKTNQFNLTGLRLTDLELNRLLRDSKWLFFQFSLMDNLGDHGNVLLIAFEIQPGNKASIRLFNMSCRVIGRNLEFAALNLAIEFLSDNLDIIEFSCEPIQTEKNVSFLNFFASFGFTQSGDSVWNFRVGKSKIKRLTKLIEFEVNDGNR